MTRDDVQRWLDRYVDAWRTYEVEAIGDLFAADATYRYHPYDDEAVVGREAIVADWRDNQDEPGSWSAHYEPWAIDGDRAVAIGESRYTEPGRLAAFAVLQHLAAALRRRRPLRRVRRVVHGAARAPARRSLVRERPGELGAEVGLGRVRRRVQVRLPGPDPGLPPVRADPRLDGAIGVPELRVRPAVHGHRELATGQRGRADGTRWLIGDRRQAGHDGFGRPGTRSPCRRRPARRRSSGRSAARTGRPRPARGPRRSAPGARRRGRRCRGRPRPAGCAQRPSVGDRGSRGGRRWGRGRSWRHLDGLGQARARSHTTRGSYDGVARAGYEGDRDERLARSPEPGDLPGCRQRRRLLGRRDGLGGRGIPKRHPPPRRPRVPSPRRRSRRPPRRGRRLADRDRPRCARVVAGRRHREVQRPVERLSRPRQDRATRIVGGRLRSTSSVDAVRIRGRPSDRRRVGSAPGDLRRGQPAGSSGVEAAGDRCRGSARCRKGPARRKRPGRDLPEHGAKETTWPSSRSVHRTPGRIR